MKHDVAGFSRRYVAALRKHLRQGRGGTAAHGPATRLGCEAIALGLEAREFAGIHSQALAALELSNDKTGWHQRADLFFAKANAPLEKAQGTGRRTQADVSKRQESLSQCIGAPAVGDQQLQTGIARQKLMKTDFAASGKHHHKCLTESLQLEKLLRQLTHQALTAQEDDRTKLSHELQNEIAQTLLGINVRLLTLKQHGGHDPKGLKNEIASAQRLVLKSAKSVRQFARKLAPHHSRRSAPSRSPLP